MIHKGLFKGLKLIKDSNISKVSLALRMYGLYEEVVVNEIIKD